MRVAVKIVLLAAVAGLSACGEPASDPETNEAARAAAPTEVEALPPDESVATPTQDLANGAVEPPESNAALAPAPGEPLVAVKGPEPHD